MTLGYLIRQTFADTLQIYLVWINTRQVSLGQPLRFSQMQMDQISESFDLLIDCYEAGKKLLDNDFKDAIIDTIIQLATITRVFPINFIKRIYNLTHAGSSFRRLIVDMAVHANVVDWWQDNKNRSCCTEEALWDVVAAMKRYEQSIDPPEVPFENDMCAYHHHRFFKRPCYREKMATSGVHPHHLGPTQ